METLEQKATKKFKYHHSEPRTIVLQTFFTRKVTRDISQTVPQDKSREESRQFQEDFWDVSYSTTQFIFLELRICRLTRESSTGTFRKLFQPRLDFPRDILNKSTVREVRSSDIQSQSFKNRTWADTGIGDELPQYARAKLPSLMSTSISHSQRKLLKLNGSYHFLLCIFCSNVLLCLEEIHWDHRWKH